MSQRNLAINIPKISSPISPDSIVAMSDEEKTSPMTTHVNQFNKSRRYNRRFGSHTRTQQQQKEESSSNGLILSVHAEMIKITSLLNDHMTELMNRLDTLEKRIDVVETTVTKQNDKFEEIAKKSIGIAVQRKFETQTKKIEELQNTIAINESELNDKINNLWTQIAEQ